MSEDIAPYGLLDFGPLIEHVRPGFPKSLELHVERQPDGTVNVPLGVQWTAMLPIGVLEAMGVHLVITQQDGSVLDPVSFGRMAMEQVQREEAEHKARVNGSAAIHA